MEPGAAGEPQVERFRRWVGETRGVEVPDYRALQRWSVEDLAGFWGAIWEWFSVPARAAPSSLQVLGSASMPGATWFPGTTLNYVDQVMRHAELPGLAVVDRREPEAPDGGGGDGSGRLGGTAETAEAAGVAGAGVAGSAGLGWAELRRQTGALAATLRGLGVRPGDRVIGYLPNIPEAVVAFLATASLGAIWSACGQDYAPHAAADRLAQLRPAVLVAADGYRHGGRAQDRRNALVELAGHLRDAGDLRATISVPRLGLDQPSGTLGWEEVTAGDDTLDPLEVPFDHPLWVLFSSGTTGRPKGIVHGHGGVLLEHLKQAALHADLRAGERFCWYTSPSWMMWNYQLAGLLVGATIVTYDGSPGWPATGSLFGLAAEERLAVLGTSPAYLLACEKAGCHPGAGHDLSSLRLLGVTGSVLPASSYRWAETELGGRVTIGAISGGTDVVSAFVGSTPGVPTRPGELAGAHLGVALDAWDPEGHPVRGEVGELVVTEPMPSMPLRLWDDPDGSRYREAYFSTYPGVWRHGDWVTITEHGGVVIHGRSDSTLNRHGIRMGSAEIYEAVESLPEVVESLVVGVEEPGGGYWMPLFVVLGAGSELDEQLEQAIRRAVREQVSPRHVPDEVIAVRAVPHTRTGKKLEVPVKRLLQGAEASAVLDPGAIDDPGALADFVAAAQRRARTSG